MLAHRPCSAVEDLDEARAGVREIALPVGQQMVEGATTFRNEVPSRSEVVSEKRRNAVRRGLKIGTPCLEDTVERLAGAVEDVAGRGDMGVEQTRQMIGRRGEIGSVKIEHMAHLGQGLVDVREPVGQPVRDVPGERRRLRAAVSEDAIDLAARDVHGIPRTCQMVVEKRREALARGGDLGTMTFQNLTQRGGRMVDVVADVGGAIVDQGRQPVSR